MTSLNRPPLISRAFVLVSASHFLHALAFNLYLHLPGFLKGLGATELHIGLLFGVTAATAIGARPMLGRVMDTRGRRVVIVAGGVLTTVVCSLYLTVFSLGPLVVLVRVAHGIGEAMLFASLFAFAADIVPPSRRIEGIALFGVAGMLPSGLGGVLGDVILSHATYRELFIVSAVFSGVALALSLPLRDHAGPTGERSRGVLVALVQRDLLPLWFIGGVFATSVAAHATFMKTFVMSVGVGSVGLFFTAYSIAAVALRIGFGALPERVGPKRALFPALAACAAGCALLVRVDSAAGLAFAGALCGLGHGYVFPILLGLVVARARASERGGALAIFTALFDGGLLVGGPVLGALIRAFGYRTMFATASALVAAGAVVFAVWDRGFSAGVEETPG